MLCVAKLWKIWEREWKQELYKNNKDFIKYTSKPTCSNWNIYEKKLVAIHEKKVCLTLKKAIYVGFSEKDSYT